MLGRGASATKVFCHRTWNIGTRIVLYYLKKARFPLKSSKFYILEPLFSSRMVSRITWLVLALAAVPACATAPAIAEPPPVLAQVERGQVVDDLEDKLHEGLCHESARGVFDDAEVLASIDAFCGIEGYWLSKRFSFKRDEDVTVLYPGAGAHLSPLQFAHTLAAEENFPNLHFIYTEVIENTPQIFQDRLEKLSDYGFRFVKKEEKKFDKGREVTLHLAVKHPWGKKEQGFKVTYAIDRSEPDKGDHPFFRQEYADRARIIVTHDINQEDDPALFTSYLKAVARDPEQKMIIFDDFLRMCSGTLRSYSSLPGDISVIAKPYGCVHKPGSPGVEIFNCAVAYFPNGDEVRGMSSGEISGALRETFGDLFDAPRLYQVGSPLE